ncbi:hypothetical protein INR49_005970, partial [Caranx melampygus]
APGPGVCSGRFRLRDTFVGCFTLSQPCARLGREVDLLLRQSSIAGISGLCCCPRRPNSQSPHSSALERLQCLLPSNQGAPLAGRHFVVYNGGGWKSCWPLAEPVAPQFRVVQWTANGNDSKKFKGDIRGPGAPSRVIHIRRLPNDITETEVIAWVCPLETCPTC